MGYSGGVVTAPVGFGDISQAVHYSSLDLGTLITSGSINKWAKYKPVPTPEVTYYPAQYDTTNNKWKADATWWKCVNPCVETGSGVIPLLPWGCGFRIKSTSSVASIPGLYSGAPWSYQRPRGLGTYGEWFRALDFAGYNESATPIVIAEDFISYRSLVQYQDPDPLRFSCYHEQPTTPIDELEWEDFDTLKTKYFGVILRNKNNTSSYIFATAANPIVYNGGYNLEVELDTRTLNIGTYEAFPFLSTNAVTQGSATSPGEMYVLPFIPAVEIEVASTLFVINATNVAYTGVGYNISWALTVVNRSGNAMSFTNSYCVCRKPGKAWDSAWDSDESATVQYINTDAGGQIVISSTSGSFNIAGNTSKSIGRQFSMPNFNGGYLLFVFGSYHESFTPEQPHNL